MKRIAPATYECDADERIQIEFFSSQGRDNVRIFASFDGTIFNKVEGNSLRFKLEGKDVSLRMQYAFILTGTCDNEVTVVVNRPNNEDIVTASAITGQTDFLTFIFQIKT